MGGLFFQEALRVTAQVVGITSWPSLTAQGIISGQEPSAEPPQMWDRLWLRQNPLHQVRRKKRQSSTGGDFRKGGMRDEGAHRVYREGSCG